eukprot:TRINITY_DN8220_c0_g4_i1.p1 TRINITY_DN8220_c0_g4~~TRINITY_DN8220_c0_g4_i1.p1  ORF type:complete len:219 (+),score=45.57 TRINITY_DN8220_c0_g4_i1:75-731(+)
MKFYPYKSFNPYYRSPIVTFTLSSSPPKPRLVDQLNKLAASSSARHYLQRNRNASCGAHTNARLISGEPLRQVTECLLRPVKGAGLPVTRCYDNQEDDARVGVYNLEGEKWKKEQERKYRKKEMKLRMQPYATMMLKDEEIKSEMEERAKRLREKIDFNAIKLTEDKGSPLPNLINVRANFEDCVNYSKYEADARTVEDDDNYCINGYLKNFKPYTIN